MRRRHDRRPVDLDEAWCESLHCWSPDWHAVMDSLPESGGDDGAEQIARAWLSWPGRGAWLAAHPPDEVRPDEPWFPRGGHYGREGDPELNASEWAP